MMMFWRILLRMLGGRFAIGHLGHLHRENHYYLLRWDRPRRRVGVFPLFFELLRRRLLLRVFVD